MGAPLPDQGPESGTRLRTKTKRDVQEEHVPVCYRRTTFCLKTLLGGRASVFCRPRWSLSHLGNRIVPCHAMPC